MIMLATMMLMVYLVAAEEFDPQNVATPHSPTSGSTLFYVAAGLTVPVVVSFWIFWRRKHNKINKLRQNLFRSNGGQLLQSLLSVEETLEIFTADDLRKATDNYDENKICDRESPFGITYHGVLHGRDKRVTIQKCENAIEDCDIEAFIKRLVALSRICNKNVVQLIGCCLETRVPLLVYESITNMKTLHDYIHHDAAAPASHHLLRVRLSIAAQAAAAVAHMHSGMAAPVIHGNLKSSGILLDQDDRVKVCDFAFLNHINPDVRMTEKSDVYSFGVVLVELLTGNTVLKAGDQGHGVGEFITACSVGDFLVDNLDPRMDRSQYYKSYQLTQIVELAKTCLSHSSADMPTMKQVAIALEAAANSMPLPVPIPVLVIPPLDRATSFDPAPKLVKRSRIVTP